MMRPNDINKKEIKIRLCQAKITTLYAKYNILGIEQIYFFAFV